MDLNDYLRLMASQQLTKMVYLMLLLSGLLLSGCQTMPDTQAIIKDTNQQAQDLEIKGIKKNLSQNHVDQAINNLADNNEDEALLEKQLKITQEIINKPLIAGNDTQLLFDGEQTFKAIFEAVNSAQSHINLEYFILENIQYQNTSLEEVLIKKRNKGVAVNVIYDAFGSININKAFVDNLKNAGVEITVFQPIEDLENIDEINYRDHRKMLIVDGKVAVVGGVNLSSTYQSKSLFGLSGASEAPKNATEAYWRDTDLLVKGPAVAELQTLFLEHWDTNQPIDKKTFFRSRKRQATSIFMSLAAHPKMISTFFMPHWWQQLITLQKELS